MGLSRDRASQGKRTAWIALAAPLFPVGDFIVAIRLVLAVGITSTPYREHQHHHNDRSYQDRLGSVPVTWVAAEAA
jgi:hypothetical protein